MGPWVFGSKVSTRNLAASNSERNTLQFLVNSEKLKALGIPFEDENPRHRFNKS